MPKRSQHPDSSRRIREKTILLASIGTARRRSELLTAASPNSVVGVSEETTTGVASSYDGSRTARCDSRHNVNGLVTNSKFDNLYGCRESLHRRHQNAPPT